MATQYANLDFSQFPPAGQYTDQYPNSHGPGSESYEYPEYYDPNYQEGQAPAPPNLEANGSEEAPPRERRKKKRREEGGEGEGEERHRRHRKKHDDAEDPTAEGEAGGERRKKKKHRRPKEGEGQPGEVPAIDVQQPVYYQEPTGQASVDGNVGYDDQYPPAPGDYPPVSDEYPPEPDDYPPAPEEAPPYYQHTPEVDLDVPEGEPFVGDDADYDHLHQGYPPAGDDDYTGEPYWHPDDQPYSHEGSTHPSYHPDEMLGVHPAANGVALSAHLDVPPVEVSADTDKKKGGLGKFFASLRKSKQRKHGAGVAVNAQWDNQTGQPIDGESAEVHEHWQSNPQLFNPALDNTLEPQPRYAADNGKQAKGHGKVSGSSGRHHSSTMARVILLDGEEVTVEIDKKATGQNLFERICHATEIMEMDYFGMTFVNRKVKTWFWLDMEKKIYKQLCHGEEWIFNFQVKFYPPEPSLLQEDITRYQLSLQVRQDIYTGKLPCSWITQALLGSFMVQSELGDYDTEEHGPGVDYLRDFEFVYNPTDQLLEKIAELHKKNAGMKPDQADLKYLETAKRLEQYGVDLHPARDMEDIDIYIGVCFHGVVVYRDRLRIGRFAWPKVLRISYKKNVFYLKIRSDYYEEVEAVVGFGLLNHYLAKRLWKSAVEHHTFFRLKEPRIIKKKSALALGSKYQFSGRTFFQYRTMTIDRPRPNFDRSLIKKRTASLPAGLNSTGLQYSSMHSLSRVHPRDMTLGKTQSVEYLGPRRYGSATGSLNDLPSGGLSAGGRIVTRTNQAPFSSPVVTPRGSVGGGGSVTGSNLRESGRGSVPVQGGYGIPRSGSMGSVNSGVTGSAVGGGVRSMGSRQGSIDMIPPAAAVTIGGGFGLPRAPSRQSSTSSQQAPPPAPPEFGSRTGSRYSSQLTPSSPAPAAPRPPVASSGHSSPAVAVGFGVNARAAVNPPSFRGPPSVSSSGYRDEIGNKDAELDGRSANRSSAPPVKPKPKKASKPDNHHGLIQGQMSAGKFGVNASLDLRGSQSSVNRNNPPPPHTAGLDTDEELL